MVNFFSSTYLFRSCAWSPDGKMIATASFDGTVVIWEAQNSSNSRWELVASLEGHENEVKCVCWSNDGKWIATCGRDKSVWIWENIGQGEFECVSSMTHILLI
jgi:cytosolic iron-sulfur protein assembly protein CIAO1